MLKLLLDYRIAALATLSLLLCACGPTSDPFDGTTTVVPDALLPAELTWPPAAGPQRSASDDSIELLGSEFSAAGGGAHAVSTVCKLNGGTAPWAIYSLSSFNTVELGSIKVDYNKLVGEGTILYIGMANYAKDRWEWYSTEGNGAWTFNPVVPADYASPAGNVHIALLRTGPATIDLQKVTFFRVGEVTITPPQNLRSDEQTPENIGLQWDPVPGADSYNLYFSRYSDLREPIKVNADPIIGEDFDYAPVLKGIIYYFHVTAVGASESDASEFIDIFAPLIDMPAPMNPSVIESTPTSVTIGWEWDTDLLGPEPANGFYVYMKPEKDFNLEPLIEIKYRSQPWARTALFTGLQESKLYYYRICGASLNNARGRMTDDLPALTGEYWNWTEANPVSAGREPIRALATGSQITAIWLEADSGTGSPTGSVSFSQGLGASWTTGGCGLDADTENFQNYLDLDERGGNFLISAYDNINQDLFASFGSPTGGWTKEFVADGTKVGQFDVPSAGHYGDCAITDDSYNIIHKDFYAKMTYMHSRPVGGGGWTRADVRPLGDGAFPVELELETNGNTLEFLYFDYEIHELLFGQGPAPFAPVQISDNMGSNNGLDADLLMTPGGWISPSYDSNGDDLYLLRQNGSSWDLEDIAVSPGNASGYGNNARLEAFRNGLICVYLNNTNDWYASVYDGSQWFQQVMLLPLNAASTAELVVVADEPYFLVEDIDEDMIYCVKGVIPPFDQL